MEPAPPRKKDWVLTQDAFDKLLAGLDPDDPTRAGEKYEELRSALSNFFRWKRCPYPDEHTDETLNRVARRMAEGTPVRSVADYAREVARYLLHEIWRQPAVEQEPEDGFADRPAASDGSGEELNLTERRLGCLEGCVEGLPAPKREVIVGFYEGDGREKINNRAALAEKLGLTPNALKIRACRIRMELEACINHCVEGAAR